VRATDRFTQAAATHKRRIKHLVRQLLPCSPLVGELGMADLAVLERWADPHALVRAGRQRLHQVIVTASNRHLGSARVEQWLAAAHAALELYGDHPAVAFQDLAAEVATEVRLLRATQAELAAHASKRESCYRWVDPGALARSLPGLATVGGPTLAATMGTPGRFAHAGKFRAFTGLAPKASETGHSDRKGQPISKAGNRLLRSTLHRAADNARRIDPQLARIYWIQMVERGKDHLGAVCVVAAHLAERAWMVMDRGLPYVICDTDGVPVTPIQAKQIIAERYTVPEEVRRRRRHKKGKAPQQVLTGHVQGAQGATRRPSPSPPSLGRQPTQVKPRT
jgi:Transposase IS116/IS110/IS902 family